MIAEELQLKEARGKAQKKLEGIFNDILDSQQSLCHLLVKAYRAGIDPEKPLEAFEALRNVVKECQDVYEAAIAQPEPKIRTQSRVAL